MNTSSPRVWIAGTVVLCLALVAAGWFLLVSPQRAEAADLRDQTEAADQRNAQLEVRIAELKEEFAQLPQRKAELAAVQKAMPADPELAVLTRDLQRLATEAGVTLMSISPGEVSTIVPSVVAAPEPVAPTAETGAADASAPADGAAAPVDGAASVEAPVVVTLPPGLAQLPVSVVVVGPFEASREFLEKVQDQLDRDYLVDMLTVVAEEASGADGGKPAVSNGDVMMTLTGRVFVLDPDAATTSTGAVAGTSTN
jgi:hypothetical protein